MTQAIRDRTVLERVAMFAPAAIAFAVYLPVLGNGFVWDDRALLASQPALLDPSLWGSAITGLLADVWSPNYFRPVGVATFLVEGQIWGLNPAGFHLTNAAIHALNTFLVTLLAGHLLGPGLGSRQRAIFAAGGGLIFGLHPALVESVAFTSSRFDLLTTTAVLLTLLADVRLRAHGALRFVAIGVLFFVAALVKETAVALPIILYLWRVAVDGEEWSRESAPTVVALAVAAVAAVMLRYAALGGLYRLNPLSAIPTGDFIQHALLVGRSVLEYFLLVLAPFVSVKPLHVTSLPIPHDDPLGWVGVALVVTLAAGLLSVFGRWPRFVALVVAGGVALVPALNLVPLELVGGAFAAERYLALPLACFSLAVCAILPQLPLRVQTLQLAALIWFAACVTMIQFVVPRWKDEPTFWAWAAERAPSSSLPHIGLSTFYVEQGDHARALAEADAAIEREATAIKAWNNRGIALFNAGEVEEAQAAWERATELAPAYALAWSNLANAYAVQGDLEKAERILVDQALQLDPELGMARFTLGEVYLSTDRPDLAIPQLELALRLLPPSHQGAARESLARARAADR